MKKYIFNLKNWIYALLLLFPVLILAQEGTKQVSPSTSLLSGLYYNPTTNYGSYFNAPDENQIHFAIKDFNTENFYFGFNWTEYGNLGATNTALNYAGNTTSYFYYQILDPTGSIVAGPTLLQKSATNAAGQILNFTQAQAGPKIGTFNATGYTPAIFTPTSNGIFTIKYWRGTSATDSTINNTPSVSPFFDFTVATTATGQLKAGRVFATKWGLVTTLADASNQYFTDITTVGSPVFYVYTDAKNVLKLELPSVQPLAYVVGANYYGVNNTGNFTTDRKSVNDNPTDPTLAGGYDVYLNAPDPALFPSPPVATAPSFFGTSIITPVNGCNVAPYNINFKVGAFGDYRLIIKGSGYTDRVFYLYGLSAGTGTFAWDGKDGAGTLVAPTNIYTFELTAFSDRFNLPVVDIEKNSGGVKITTIAPTGVLASNLFWDDSGLTPFGTTGPNDNNTAAGTNNSALGIVSPSHSWAAATTGTNYYTYFGNARTINTWGYLYFQTIYGTSNLLCADVTVTKSVDNATPTIGNNVVFTLKAINNTAGAIASGVTVTDVLPAGFTFVSAAAPAGTTWSSPTWTIGTLTNGADQTLTITATVNSNTNYTNIASISTVNYETNYNNNVAYVKVTPAVLPDITVTNICPTNDINVVLPVASFDLSSVYVGITPPGATLVWFNNSTHNLLPLVGTIVTVPGSYYAFYYDSVTGCYSPPSAKVTFVPQDCKCRKSPATGTPDGYTKLGITTQTTKSPNWPSSIANGFIALESTNKGFVITRTTTASITTPIVGMLIYDTTNKCFSLYNGTSWHCIAQTCIP